MPLKPIEKTTVVDDIVNQIKSLIINGELKVGDRLASERDLAVKFNVGRPSVRVALRELTSLGILEKRQNGYFISSNTLDGIYDPILFEILMSKSNYDDLFQARKIIETEIIKLAVKNIKKEQLDKLELIAKESFEAQNNPIEFTELDVQFHICIAESANNKVLYIFLKSIRELLKQNILKVLSNEEMVKTAFEYHIEILNAIKNKDTEKAVQFLIEHLEAAKKYY